MTKKTGNIKKGERYLNHLGEYCIIKSVYRKIIKIQICGENSREETWKAEHFNKKSLARFMEVPFPKINRANIAGHLLEYQLNVIGKTTLDTKRDPDWFNTWTINTTDYDLFKSYAIPLLKKTFKFNKTKAVATFEWWYLQFGLNKIKDVRKNN